MLIFGAAEGFCIYSVVQCETFDRLIDLGAKHFDFDLGRFLCALCTQY